MAAPTFAEQWAAWQVEKARLLALAEPEWLKEARVNFHNAMQESLLTMRREALERQDAQWRGWMTNLQQNQRDRIERATQPVAVDLSPEGRIRHIADRVLGRV
jgi:hypothetical protein